MLKAYMNKTLKGPDHTELGTKPRAGFPSFDPVVWESMKLVAEEVKNGFDRIRKSL